MLDKLEIIENIKMLAKFRKISLKDLEKKIAGVSEGYFARLASDIKAVRELSSNENQKERPLPPVEVIVKIADALTVSVDQILNVNFAGKEDPEIAILTFLDSLKDKTVRNEFIWEAEPADSLYDGKPYGKFQHHPLMKHVIDEYNDYWTFYSLFQDRECSANGIYTLNIGNGREFFLCHISYLSDSGDWSRIELYATKDDAIQKLVDGSPLSTNQIDVSLQKLLSAVVKNNTLNPAGRSIVSLLDEYSDIFDSVNNEKKGGN